MKHLRATVRADHDQAPPLFRLLAHSPHVEEARVLEQQTNGEGYETYLVAIDGDVSGFAERAACDGAIELVSTSRFGEELAAALLVVRPHDSAAIEADPCSVDKIGVVVRYPIVYRDGTMRARVVGDPAHLQRSVEGDGSRMGVTIEEIGEFHGGRDTGWAGLSGRQREALEVATELGYYEQPRRATHGDVADAIGCAPQTASDHLQKAESKVIAAALDEFGPLG